VGRFVAGLTPAVAVLMLFVAWKVLTGSSDTINWQMVVLSGASLIALVLDAPAPLVLLVAGVLGIFIF
jgi:chromate transport protein ChrA